MLIISEKTFDEFHIVFCMFWIFETKNIGAYEFFKLHKECLLEHCFVMV